MDFHLTNNKKKTHNALLDIESVARGLEEFSPRPWMRALSIVFIHMSRSA